MEIEELIREALQKATRPRDSLKVLAVSKTKPVESIVEASSAGQQLFGESYMQEAVPKIKQLREMEEKAKDKKMQLDWHFVGRLQSSKVKDFIENFSLLHSLDRFNLAEKLHEAAQERKEKVKALVQVNVHREANKGGLYPENLKSFLEECNKLDHLNIEGLMCIPNYEEQKKNPRKAFALLRELMEEANKNSYYRERMQELSMGMSDDFEAGILEGSTIVRLGTVVFGPREGKLNG